MPLQWNEHASQDDPSSTVGASLVGALGVEGGFPPKDEDPISRLSASLWGILQNPPQGCRDYFLQMWHSLRSVLYSPHCALYMCIISNIG